MCSPIEDNLRVLSLLAKRPHDARYGIFNDEGRESEIRTVFRRRLCLINALTGKVPLDRM